MKWWVCLCVYVCVCVCVCVRCISSWGVEEMCGGIVTVEIKVKLLQTSQTRSFDVGLILRAWFTRSASRGLCFAPFLSFLILASLSALTPTRVCVCVCGWDGACVCVGAFHPRRDEKPPTICWAAVGRHRRSDAALRSHTWSIDFYTTRGAPWWSGERMQL